MEPRTSGASCDLLLVGSSPHRCRHCERAEIAVPADVCSSHTSTRRQWRFTLNHTLTEASRAASDGCLFFSWLWNEIQRSDTPEQQLLRTQIQFELGTGETTGALVAESSHSLAVVVATINYSWPAARFDLVSSFGRKPVSTLYSSTGGLTAGNCSRRPLGGPCHHEMHCWRCIRTLQP